MSTSGSMDEMSTPPTSIVPPPASQSRAARRAQVDLPEPMSYAGNFPLVIPPDRFVLLVLVGMAAYALVAFLHIRRIKKVPLSIALKVQE